MENKTWRNVDAEAIKYYADKYEGMWFAVQEDEEQWEWDYGSMNLTEAAKMLCNEDAPTAFILVVDPNNGDSTAVDAIYYDDIRA